MLFEELVEQHRVHRVVPHCERLSVLIAQHQSGIHLCDFFRDQTKLRCVLCIAFVVKGDWPESKEHATSVLHTGDVLFKPLRGGYDTQLSAVGHNDRRGIATLCSHAPNVADPGTVVDVRTNNTVAETHDIKAGTDPFAGECAQRDVGTAGGVGKARAIAQRSVAVASGIAAERIPPHADVERARVNLKRITAYRSVGVAPAIIRKRFVTDRRVIVGRVRYERLRPHGRVPAAFDIGAESRDSVGRVVFADSVARKCRSTNGRVVISDVGGERPGADSSVGRAAHQAVERQHPNRCVVMASSQIPKGGLSFSGVAVLKPALRVRDNRLRSIQNYKAGEQECNDE